MILNNDVTRESLTDVQIEEQPLLTTDQVVYFQTVNVAVVCCIVGLFGMVASIINMVVFVKQGLNTTINISLFSLSVSDFCGLTTLVWLGICLNPLVVSGDTVIYSEEIGYMTGGWPHACFARITCWLTAYITAERCICVALPLKSKQIITPRRTAFIMCCIYVWTIGLLAPQYVVTCFEWNEDERRNNKTVLRLHYIEEVGYLDAISYILNTTNGTLSFSAVTIFTVVLIVKLGQQRMWRKTTVMETTNNKKNKDKEKKTMFMVLMISCLLICCYFPGLVSCLVTFLEPEFGMTGVNENVFVASWSFFFILEAVNASVNIFFYYKMSTKYKKTFIEIFAVSCKHKHIRRLT